MMCCVKMRAVGQTNYQEEGFEQARIQKRLTIHKNGLKDNTARRPYR